MDKMIKAVMDRANEMLRDAEVNAMYQAHETKDQAQEWLIRVAVATLVIPVDQRQSTPVNNSSTNN